MSRTSALASPVAVSTTTGRPTVRAEALSLVHQAKTKVTQQVSVMMKFSFRLMDQSEKENM